MVGWEESGAGDLLPSLLAGLQFGSGCIAPSSATDSGEPPLPQPQVLPGFSDTPPQSLTLSCPTGGDQGLPGAANLLLTKSLHLFNEPLRVWFLSWCGLDRYSNIDNKQTHKLFIRWANMLCRNIKVIKSVCVCPCVLMRWHHTTLSNMFPKIPFPTLVPSLPSLTGSNLLLLGFPLDPQFFLSVLIKAGQPITLSPSNVYPNFPS